MRDRTIDTKDQGLWADGHGAFVLECLANGLVLIDEARDERLDAVGPALPGATLDFGGERHHSKGPEPAAAPL